MAEMNNIEYAFAQEGKYGRIGSLYFPVKAVKRAKRLSKRTRLHILLSHHITAMYIK